MHARRDLHFGARMPTGAIQDDHDDLVRTRSHIVRKCGQDLAEHINAYGRHEPPVGVPSGRMHQPIQIEPLIPITHGSDRALSTTSPDTPAEGFQADPMFIKGPGLNRQMRVVRMDLPDQVGQFF
jgi:hypothetical protein